MIYDLLAERRRGRGAFPFPPGTVRIEGEGAEIGTRRGRFLVSKSFLLAWRREAKKARAVQELYFAFEFQ